MSHIDPPRAAAKIPGRPDSSPSPETSMPTRSQPATDSCVRACPVCGGSLYEIRHKLHCQRCHSIVETCCEGGRG